MDRVIGGALGWAAADISFVIRTAPPGHFAPTLRGHLGPRSAGAQTRQAPVIARRRESGRYRSVERVWLQAVIGHAVDLHHDHQAFAALAHVAPCFRRPRCRNRRRWAISGISQSQKSGGDAGPHRFRRKFDTAPYASSPSAYARTPFAYKGRRFAHSRTPPARTHVARTQSRALAIQPRAVHIQVRCPASRLQSGATDFVWRGRSPPQNMRGLSRCTPIQRRPLCSCLHAVEQNRPGKDQCASRGRRAYSDAAQSEGGPAEAHPNQLESGPARNSLAKPAAELPRSRQRSSAAVEAKPNVGRETYGAVPLPMKFIIRTMMKITMKM